MGLFLAMSGVIGGRENSVADTLRAYAEENEGSLDKAELTIEDDGCLVISEGVSGATVLYPRDFFDWDSASKYLSERLRRPVFSFHIHDGDLWMYLLFENGRVVDQFNPVPDYWQDLEDDDEGRRSWQGDAAEVARRVPGLASELIAKYLVPWDDKVFKAAERKKAYPTDEFYYGDEWQLVDFMRKLALDYPLDDRGEPHGAAYRFQCRPADDS